MTPVVAAEGEDFLAIDGEFDRAAARGRRRGHRGALAEDFRRMSRRTARAE